MFCCIYGLLMAFNVKHVLDCYGTEIKLIKSSKYVAFRLKKLLHGDKWFICFHQGKQRPPRKLLAHAPLSAARTHKHASNTNRHHSGRAISV